MASFTAGNPKFVSSGPNLSFVLYGHGNAFVLDECDFFPDFLVQKLGEGFQEFLVGFFPLQIAQSYVKILGLYLSAKI